MQLVVNRSKERKNKFRKKAESGDVLSLENFFECVMFGVQGEPSISFQIDPTRESSLHDLNTNEVRDLLLCLLGVKLGAPKNIKVKNGPFFRRVVHLHVSNVPGGNRFGEASCALLSGLGLGAAKCVRVDKEIDELGCLPYKLLTVPFARAAELAPQRVPQRPEAAAGDTSSTGTAAAGASEEDRAALGLAPYVLSPAELHLWGFPAAPAAGKTSAEVESAMCGTKHALDGATSPPAKVPRVESRQGSESLEQTFSLQAQKGARGSALACLPATHAEALAILAEAGLSPPSDQDLSVQQSTLPTSSPSHRSLWATVSVPAEVARAVQVASVDCEMCQTAQGEELTRVSLLAFDGSVLLDVLVLPSRSITDYKTQYSGISEELLRGVSTTLAQVQVALLRLVSAETILVGHSLDSDLRALRLHHPRCVDTALAFPHPRGYPMRLKLRKLAEDYLQQRIQANGSNGHDSTEDARATLQLALLKAANGPLFGVKKPEQQRCPCLGLLDLRTTRAALLWQDPDRAARNAALEPSTDLTSGALGVEETVLTTAVVSGAHSSGAATAAVVVEVVTTVVGPGGEEGGQGTAAGPESCVGGNAACRYLASAAEVVQEVCSEVLASVGDAEETTFTVHTIEDKAAGPVSSWVAGRGGGAEQGVEAVNVVKNSYIFGNIIHPVGGGKESGFVDALSAHIAQVKVACTAAAASGTGAGSTLLLVTAQDSLQPVLDLMRRKRALSRNTLATAMWAAEDEMRLREMRKHNLAHLLAVVV